MKILVLNDTRSENHHGCSRVMNAIDRNLFVRGFKDICYFKLMLRWDLDEDSKRKLLQTDLLIINGEGTLHGNLPHVQSLLNVIKFAKSYGVTVALINATLFNLSQESITKLGEVDYLFVRDKASMKLMELNDIKTFYCPDLALWDPFPIREKVPRSGSAMSDGHGSLRLISREEMSSPLKNSTGSISTLCNITKHAKEIQNLIGGTMPFNPFLQKITKRILQIPMLFCG